MRGQGAIKAGRAFVELFADESELARGLKKAQGRLRRFGTAVRGIGMQMVGFGAAVGAAFALCVKAAGDAVETVNKFEAVFAGQAAAAGKFADELAGAVGRSRYEIRDSLASLHAFFVGLGFGAEEARKMSQEMELLSVDFASFYNLQDPEALDKFQSGLAGMSRPLRQYGINLLESAVQEKALAMGLAETGAELTMQDKVLARHAIIMETMGKQGAVGDAVRTAGTFQNRMKALRGQIRDTAVEIGKTLLPVVTPLVDKAVKVVKVIGKWAAANKKIVVTIAKLVAAIAGGGGILLLVGMLAGAVAALMSPVALVIGAVALLTAGFAALGLKAVAAGTVVKATASDADTLVGRYEELARKTERTIEEQEELRKVTKALRDLFPQYAREVDGTTRAVRALCQAVKELREEELRTKLEEALEAERKELRKLREEYADVYAGIQAIQRTAKAPFGALFEEFGVDIEETVMPQIEEAEDALKDISARMRTRMAVIREIRMQLGELDRPPGVPPPAAPPPPEPAPDVEDVYDRRRQLEYDIARLHIQLTKKGMEKELDLLDLRRDRELELAKGLIEDMLVMKKFWLEKQLLLAGAKIETAVTTSVRGTFSAAAIWGLGMGNTFDRTARATEETAKNTGRLAENTGRMVFVRP